MSKFFVESSQIKEGKVNILGEDVNHIINVLRLDIDDLILICDNNTNITYSTKISKISKESVMCNILEKVEQTTESNVDVTVFQGLPKADKMEYIIQKTTELGVKKIIPVFMKRCIVKLQEKDKNKKLDRWRKIAEVAAKQSGRDMIPIVEDIIEINKVKDMICSFDVMLVAYENEKNVTLKNVLKKLHSKSKDNNIKIGVIVGPEGGLEEQDVKELKENGAEVVTLGNRILRTETAPLTVLSNIMYEFD